MFYDFADFPKVLKRHAPVQIPARAYVVKVYDGDTITVVLDRRFKDTSLMRIRIRNLNAAELNEAGGAAARDHLAKLLPVGTPVIVTTFKQTHDRYEGDVLFEADGVMRDVRDAMSDGGFNKP